MKPIHLVLEAYNGDIKIECEEGWDTPKWNSPTIMPGDGIYLSEKLHYYTFEPEKVTCEACKNRE